MAPPSVCMLATVLLMLAGLVRRAPAEVVTLRQAVEATLTSGPLALPHQLEAKKARFQREDAESMRLLPESTLTIEGGLVPVDIPSAGSAEPPREAWRVFTSANVRVLQPLYTSGRLAGSIHAARENERAQELRRDHGLQGLALDAMEAYLALNAARRAEEVASSVNERYDELVQRVLERFARNDPAVDDAYVLEVKGYRFRVDKLRADAALQRAFAAEGLSLLMGRPLEGVLDTADVATPEMHLPPAPDEAIRAALQARADVRGLEAGLAAAAARVRVEGAQHRPMLGIGAGAGWGHGPQAANGSTPWVSHDLNYTYLAGELVLRWDLNFRRHAIAVRQAQGDRALVEARLGALRQRVRVEVAQALRAARQSRELLLSARESLRAARNRLGVTADNWELGLVDSERVIRAHQAYYEMLGTEVAQEHQHHVRLAKLAFALGDVMRYLEWIEGGTIDLGARGDAASGGRAGVRPDTARAR